MLLQDNLAFRLVNNPITLRLITSEAKFLVTLIQAAVHFPHPIQPVGAMCMGTPQLP